MEIIDATLEAVDERRLRLTITIDRTPPEVSGRPLDFGEGPTGDAIPDRIVRCLIEHRPGSMSVAEIQRCVGGNPGTVNRQAWTLATNAPDLQLRLRGWVVK